ncbi:MAG TPA: hypothetical protein DEA78_25445 [Cyanobacteria bacterium UBA11159]|nr:hypothetical protein [Cyanobacteria bacterium UBA11366]HBR76926.1 hypothetical protein [Cyanobacteria bacterium UBA11159]HCA94733.1 hypothetical protein [Cyanobacteria bacterium UBA9226]
MAVAISNVTRFTFLYKLYISLKKTGLKQAQPHQKAIFNFNLFPIKLIHILDKFKVLTRY